MKHTLLSAKKVSKTYRSGRKTHRLLLDINLQIQPGEWHCIMGRSGSGKTSLLNCLAGLEPIDSGEILFNGYDFAQSNDQTLNMIRTHQLGFIYQAHHLILHLSALDNVAIAAILAGHPTELAQHNARESLSKLGLSGVTDQWAYTLSGGERQRVAIARALINQPKLIIADEPTGHLDQKTAEEMITQLHENCQLCQTACLIVTHDQACIRPHSQVHQLLEGQLQTVSSAMTDVR